MKQWLVGDYLLLRRSTEATRILKQSTSRRRRHCDHAIMFCSVLSRPRSEGWPHHGRTFSIYLYPSVILTESSTESPVHDLMLSIQAVHGLPRLRTPGIVPCIISFCCHF